MNAVLRGAGKRSALRRIARNPQTMIGLALMGLIVVAAASAPLLTPGNPLTKVAAPRIWPGQATGLLLGSDELGRSVLAGLLHGGALSLFIGVTATVLALLVGTLIGAAAGYFGGRLDDMTVRLIEIFQTIPGFVLLIILVAVAQPSVPTVIFGIALVSWDSIARLTRAEFRRLREREFVQAAVASGHGPARIVFVEILPNAAPVLIVTASIMVANAILMESALSFMGLSDQNQVTWGSMIGAGRDLIRTHWYLTAIPGLAISLTVLALNMIGDGLNDALNPHRQSDD